MMTDEATVYPASATSSPASGTVNHSAEEYVKTGGFHHTNTVEIHFALLKRAFSARSTTSARRICTST